MLEPYTLIDTRFGDGGWLKVEQIGSRPFSLPVQAFYSCRTCGYQFAATDESETQPGLSILLSASQLHSFIHGR